MVDEPDTPDQEDSEEQPDAGPTRRLDKAIEDIGSGTFDDGTLVSIEAHTGEHPIPPAASVTDALQQAKGKGGPGMPDIQPAATMYEPTQPGQVSGGSTQKTVFGPTGSQGNTPRSGSMNTGSAPRPVAPFGGKIVVGTRFGQIEVTGVLGKGGMGEVFKGYHHALDINVAIKVLPDELSRNELVRQRFLREARLCVKLDHPHVVRVYNVDEYAGNLYLVMEVIEGTDAAHMLKNGGRFRYKRALEIGAASADALAYAHTQGLVHRDVKPHNILLGASDGKIKISDFGLARAATSSSHLTMSGQIMGTPHYMSPEQAESKEVSDKSDVYSLGVTLYHMLTGETPFVGDTPISVAVQHIAKEIIYPEIRFKPFPKELVAVLKRMTAKDAAKRCSAKQAAVWLRKLITMAPEGDINVADPQAMKSMAPVVRESQAFEAAAKEREQRDEHARELARTMLATIHEDSGRKPAVQATVTEPAQQSASQTIVHKGSGGLVAALIVIILLLAGGGAAGWYYTLGPGAAGANKNAPIIAGGDGNTDAPPVNSGSGGTNNPPSNAGNAPANNAPANNAPANNGSSDDSGTDDGGTDDGGPVDGGPPAPVDDPGIANYLAGALTSITNADKLSDLDSVKSKLDRARMDIQRGLGSAAQREEFNDLQARYNLQRAYLGSTEGFDKIRAALDGFEAKRGSSHAEAIAFLNTAIAERNNLSKMKVPPEAEELIGAEREALVERVNTALNDLWTEIDDQAIRLEDKKQYNEAQALLTELASINNTAEKVEAVNLRLQVAKINSIHTTIRNDIQARDYTDALDQIKAAERVGIPESMKAEHTDVVASVGLAIDAALAEYLKNAIASADKGDYTSAQNALDSARDMPGRTDAQKAQYSDAVYYVDLSKHTDDAEKALTAAKFVDARKALDLAAKRVAEAVGRTPPTALLNRLSAANTKFDTDLALTFDGFLDAAEADMKKNDFNGALQNLQSASQLPHTTEQGERLSTFKAANLAALSDFVRALIGEIEAALNANNFEVARDKLASTESLPIPDDMKPKLEALQKRFDIEAVKRHGELLATAETALQKKNFVDARTALDEAALIPVPQAEDDKLALLEASYLTLISAEVKKYLDRSDALLRDDTISEGESFRQSRDQLNAAAQLHLPDDLDRQVKNKREQWAVALDAKFSQHLTDAETARSNQLFKTSDARLSDAEALPINNDQLVRVRVARDEHDAAVSAFKSDLIKKLETCVDKGQEKEGLAIVRQLEGYSPTPGEQLKINRLKEALTGETDTARRNRLPSHLQKLWNDRYCRPEQLIKVGEEISAVAVTADGKYAAAGTKSGKMYFYNLKRGTQLGSSTGGRRRITCIAFSQDGNLAACGNDDGNLVLFDISGTSVQASDMNNVGDDVFGLAFDKSGNTLFVATRDAQVTRFNPRTKAKLGAFATGLDGAQCMSLSPDDNWLAVGGDDGEIAVFDASRLVLKETLDGPGDDRIQRVAFSSDSSQLICGSIGNDVGVWDMKKLTKKPVKEYTGLSEWIQGLGFSVDGRRCAGFDSEDRVVVWDTKSGIELRRLDYSEKLKGDKDFMPSAGVIGPDGTVLIATREGELLHMQLRTAG